MEGDDAKGNADYQALKEERAVTMFEYLYMHIPLSLCSAFGSTHTESGKLYRKVKHRSPPKVLLTPTVEARLNRAALATTAETRGVAHRARPRRSSRERERERERERYLIYTGG